MACSVQDGFPRGLDPVQRNGSLPGRLVRHNEPGPGLLRNERLVRSSVRSLSKPCGGFRILPLFRFRSRLDGWFKPIAQDRPFLGIIVRNASCVRPSGRRRAQAFVGCTVLLDKFVLLSGDGPDGHVLYDGIRNA